MASQWTPSRRPRRVTPNRRRFMEFVLLRRRGSNYSLRLALAFSPVEKARRFEIGLPTKDKHAAHALAAMMLFCLKKLACIAPQNICLFDAKSKRLDSNVMENLQVTEKTDTETAGAGKEAQR